MIGRQAKTLSRRDLRRLRAIARKGRTPLRNDLIVLLAVRAGLRACEIARLTWGMVLDPSGRTPISASQVTSTSRDGLRHSVAF